MSAVRATPADPMPGVAVRADIPGPTARRLPPELGAAAIALLDGTTFMYSDAVGDIPEGSIGGLVHADTRFLSRWVFTVNGGRLLLLRSGEVDHYSAAFFLTNAELPGLPANTLGIRRLRFVGDGLRERIEVTSFSARPVTLELRLQVGNDFADLFEIKDRVRDRCDHIVRDHLADGTRLDFGYSHDGFSAGTVVQPSPAAHAVEGDDLVWRVELGKNELWQVDLHVPLRKGSEAIVPAHREFGEMFARGIDDPTRTWLAQTPTLTSDSAMLMDVAKQSAKDLQALRIELHINGQDVVLPAAGLPWFLTMFGRDTLITAYQTVCFGPGLARGALLALAELQGTECNDFRDEEPGKILHELRSGELTERGLKPHSPYYGSADTTQLWLILLSEYWRWTGDDRLVQSLYDNIVAALNWIDNYGDRDRDGYVEYATRSTQGLGNQCWRDSWDGVQFADGTIPVLPIATCELQGYVYDAKLRVAELADGPLAEPALAERLRADAYALRDRFNRDFWIDRRGGYYALGLDGDKRPIDSMTSNMGHLLWSGIVPPDRARLIVAHLMSDAMFSGWGVRTLSTEDRGYNPVGYHLGTVWPHDNSLIALGLARYGFHEETNRIAMALMDAAEFSHHRLPEAFSGYDRSWGSFPVPYPTACSPQAWASGAPLALIRAMLGLDAGEGRILLEPHLPEDLGWVQVAGTRAFGQRWDIEADGTAGYVRLASSSPRPRSPAYGRLRRNHNGRP